MTRRSTHFTNFNDHTLLKHAILRSYLQAWSFKLLQWGGAGNRVFFVDGFAGAGQDTAGKPGSPIIAATIAQQVRNHFRSAGGALRVIAVEADPHNYERLDSLLQPFNRLDPGSARSFQGSVSDHIHPIIRDIDGAPALFFLDPFGLKGLDATSYPLMLGGGHNEILALFSDIGAVRLRGLVHTNIDAAAQLNALRQSPSLFPELDVRATQDLEERVKRQRRWLDQLEPPARDAITNALGESNGVEDLRTLSPQEARTELIVRFVQRLIASGARHALVVPMRGATGAHKYCLVHASKSLKGYTTMKEAVSQSLNKEGLADEMRERIRQDLSIPMSQVWQILLSRFGGQTVRWSDPIGGSVRGLLLEETLVFNFQCAEIKQELRQRGVLTRMNRLEMCVFPRN